MSTNFAPLEIPPGVVAKATKKMRSSNWSEVNCVRWVEGQLAPIGGQEVLPFTFASRCRAIHSWYDLGEVYHTVYICETNAYVETGGILTEITPTGGVPAPGGVVGGYGEGNYGAGNYGVDPRPGATVTPRPSILPAMFSVDNFGALLLVMWSADSRLLQWDPGNATNVNDVQTLSLVGSPTGGTFALTFNGQTTASIAWNAAASAVQTALTALSNIGAGNLICSGGPLPGAVTITFQGSLGHSTQSTIGVGANALTGGTGPQPSIAHTTFGSGALLTPVSGAPSGRCFVVTGDRFVMIFGMQGIPWRFGWCDQENINDWNFASVTNQAGFLDIQPASPIVTAHASRAGWIVFFTEKKAYISRFLGLPFIYDYEELADDCTPWSPASISTTSSLLIWISQQGTFSFDGTSVAPIQCPIRPWVDGDIDLLNVRWQATAASVGETNEFWWFFPQDGQSYNTRAAIYNFKEGWWGQAHSMPRSAGSTSTYASPPLFADGTKAYVHETGIYFNDCELPWADTADLNLNAGGKLTTFKQLLPDIDGDSSNLQFSLYYKLSRTDQDTELISPPAMVRSGGYVDFRVTGRDLRLRVAVKGPSVPRFTIGQHLVDVVPRGDR